MSRHFCSLLRWMRCNSVMLLGEKGRQFPAVRRVVVPYKINATKVGQAFTPVRFLFVSL